MYQYVDRQVSELEEGARFLIWSMRRWVLAIHEGQCPPSVLGPVFSRWHMLGAMPHFHLAMILLNRQARGAIRFAPVRCPRVAEDEAVLLALMHAFTVHDNVRAHATASLLVEEDAIGGLVTCFTTLAERLTHAGIHMETSPRISPRARTRRSPEG